MSEDPVPDPNTRPAPQHSAQDPNVGYSQGVLDPPARTELAHLSDAEYEALKNELGAVGTEYDERYKGAAKSSEELRAQLGMTASGRTVEVRLLPETISRGDVDVRNKPVWAQLGQINHIAHELSRLKVATPRDEALFRILAPLMKIGESHPNEIGLHFFGKERSKGRPGRVAAFGDAMQLVQHGSEEQRQSVIDDMARRLALAKGEPDAVAIAKQLVLKGMPLLPGEEYGDNQE